MPLFRSYGHPRGPLLRHLVVTLFQQTRLGFEAVEFARGLNYDTLTAPQDAVIHPSIAEAFGMYFAGPEALYQAGDEGGFTARESVRRYLRLEWDEGLARGLWLLRRKNLSAAYPLLLAARRTSPRSPALAEALLQLGDGAEERRAAA